MRWMKALFCHKCKAGFWESADTPVEDIKCKCGQRVVRIGGKPTIELIEIKGF